MRIASLVVAFLMAIAPQPVERRAEPVIACCSCGDLCECTDCRCQEPVKKSCCQE